MGKTEAKRAYIAALLGTMKRFAMGTGEARELVGELEFVWGQIKDGGGSGSGSSGKGVSGGGGAGGARRRRREVEGDGDDGDGRRGAVVERMEGLKVLRPMSEGDEVEGGDEDDDEEEDFQDPEQRDAFEGDGIKEPSGPGFPTRATDLDVRNRKWRKGMELALGKLSVEIAALREQIESQRDEVAGRTGGVLTWTRWLLSVLMKHVLVDGVLLLLLVAWARRKEDRRLEQGLQLFYYWIREQLGRIKVPETLQRAVKSMQNVMR